MSGFEIRKELKDFLLCYKCQYDSDGMYRILYPNEMSFFEIRKLTYFLSVLHSVSFCIDIHVYTRRCGWTHSNIHYSSGENNAMKCLLIEFWLALLKPLAQMYLLSALLGCMKGPYWASGNVQPVVRLIETWACKRLIAGHEVQYLLARGKAKQTWLKIC